MSKRQKRRVSKGKQPAITKPAATPNQQAPASSWSPQRGYAAAEFNPDYTAVKKDLKRIGVLAGSFFVILIALTFILR
ncbi:MAG: hypothetical protein JW704_03840 [Anaerolineaceae bacterium]|nr:hypothetical protein [Anaerolineaceae bacterium]MBN2678126.1 hypothetical protein [Anaerolineaceae bacterium]